jgi:hypothetical protein
MVARTGLDVLVVSGADELQFKSGNGRERRIESTSLESDE